MNCQSNSLRRKGLREDLDLSGLMKADKALELNEIQAKEFKNHDKTVNVVRFNKKGTSTQPKGKCTIHKNRQESRTRQESPNRSQSQKDDNRCRNCGGPYLRRDFYLAKNKKCNPCSKLNYYYARVSKTCHARRH